MKNISVRLPDELLQEVENLIGESSVSRNSYINEAIAFFNKYQRRRRLEEQLAFESALIAEDSMEVLKEFEALEDED